MDPEINPWHVEQEQQALYDAAHAVAEHRALIEQTKGMLMFVYGVDADTAFEMLRAQSQNHNLKLRVLAEQISRDLVDLSKEKSLYRLAADSVMLTAHYRVADAAFRQMDGHSKTSE